MCLDGDDIPRVKALDVAYWFTMYLRGKWMNQTHQTHVPRRWRRKPSFASMQVTLGRQKLRTGNLNILKQY